MGPHAQMQREAAPEIRKIRCVLVHDHVLLRQGLRRLLADEPDMEVIAEAETGAEALQNIPEQRPEVVITDAYMFDCDAGQVEGIIRRESPSSKVVFLTAQERDEAHSEGGAQRQICAEELLERVRKAQSAGGAIVREMPHRARGEWPGEELLPRKRALTAREREVLKLLAEGRTVRSAASVLGLSIKTVDAHKFNLMRKLGIHNKAELVMWAIQKKVVKLPANF